MGKLKMASRCQIKGLSIALLNVFAVISFHSQATEGNSIIVLKEPSGEFQSPGYPDLDDNMQCTWKVIAPENHKIALTFLDFNLVERPICTDKVEIHGGNVKEGPYIQNDLQSQTITSTGNTISVVLRSCGVSLFSDRRGLHVSYLTVYPTTLPQTTRNKITITPRLVQSRAQSRPVESTVMGTFSSPEYPMSSNDDAFTPTFPSRTELHPKFNNPGNNNEQFSTESSGNLVPAILAGLLVSIIIVIIITIFIVKRRKSKLHSSASIATNENNEMSGEQADLPIVVVEGVAEDISHLEYDYVQGTSTPNPSNEQVVLDQNRAVFSKNMIFPRLQKKQPVFNTNNAVCVYENDANNVYNNTDFEEDYGTASCTIQGASSKVGNNDRQLQRQESNVNLDEGLVVNSAYEPYISKTTLG